MRLTEGISMFRFLAKLGRDASGGTAVEYGLILALIFFALLGAVSSFGQTANMMWNSVSNTVSGAN